jgi:hypothetical protein
LQLLKLLFSYRAYEPLGFNLGYSTDFSSRKLSSYTYRSGPTLHGGIEVVPNEQSNFFGSYEVGLPLDGSWALIHRISFAYKVRRLLTSP